MSDRSDRVKAIFLEAIEGHAPDRWPAFLERACAGDAELRAEVEKLLRARSELGSFHEPPRPGVAQTTDEPVRERPGVVIGPYKLIQELGTGGMGAVWMAQQTEPVKRLVALKVVKPGMDSRQVIARFEAERQALALMDHPNIARVFDAGTTSAGRPFFVMELVKGLPLTKFCDERRLPPRERLELFIPVCQAIQHAHQKGIIHRDIKPSNVLVALYDGKPVPKVIDFGVAKATGLRLTEHTLVTDFGAVVGTLQYMSPEQAELNQLDIDTRSDVYSLGVLLYELLTGSTPLEKKRVKEAAMLEVLRLIREEEPPRPSTRLSATDEMPSVAACRGLEPKKLSGQVRGELDWIVMKALDKDRDRRYETANGFAADLQRYLADEPVLACPPSAWYRFRKFARHNKGKLAITGLVVFFLAVLGGVTGWAMKDRADRRAALEAAVGRDLGEARVFCRADRLPEASAAVDQARALLAHGGGSEELGGRVSSVRAEVDMAVRLEGIRLEQAAVKDGNFDNAGADSRYRDAFRDYGLDVMALDADAVAQRIRASAIKGQLLAALDDWLAVQGSPPDGRLVAVLRRVDADPWRGRFRDAFGRGDRKALEDLARDPGALAQPPATVVWLGRVLVGVGERPLAVDVLRSAQQQHPNDFWINHMLALNLYRLKPSRAGEAVGYYRAALALRPDSPGVHMNLGIALGGQGDLPGAVAEYREAIRIKPEYAEAHGNLGNALRGQGDLRGAVAECKKAIALKPKFAQAHSNLGNALRDQGDLPGAVAEFKKAIRIKQDDAEAHCNLGVTLYDQGDLPGAVAEYKKSIALKPENAQAHSNLGLALRDQGDLPSAVAEFKKAIALKQDYAEAHCHLGVALNAQGDLPGAVAEYKKAIALKPEHAEAHSNLGNALRAQGDLSGAVAEYKRAIALKPDLAEAHNNLGNALHDQGNLPGAVAESKKAIALKPDYADPHHNLGNALRDQGDLPGAVAEYKKAIALKPEHAEAHCNLGNALRAQGDLSGAVAEYKRAIALKPDLAEAHCSLGDALHDQGDLAGAVAEYKRAIALKPDLAEAHYNLGNALRDQGDLPSAVAEFRKAIALKPGYAEAHNNLGAALRAQDDLPGAVAEFRKAIALKPDLGVAHNNLGNALHDQGNLPGAVAEYKKAIALKPQWAEAHCNLGNALRDQGDLAGAVAEFKKAIALKPDLAEAHYNLGVALRAQGDLPGAVAESKKAIALKPQWAEAHNNLGNALRDQGDLPSAVAEYKRAIALKPDLAEAHCCLGLALQRQGEFQTALKVLRRGHELGSGNLRWKYPSAEWVRQCERLVELDGELPRFLEGIITPASPAEHIELAGLCSLKRLHRAAARFYAEAFAAEPKLANDLGTTHRYNAACIAALAGCGQGEDADKLDGTERARLRRQALDWLHADLDEWGRLLAKKSDKARPVILKQMQHCLVDIDFAGVRGPEALAMLPEAERKPWRKLWGDVADLLSRAQEKTTPEKKSAAK